MTNPVHLLTVASLLLAAFLVGAVVGTLLRLLALRLRQQPVTAAPIAEAPAAAPPLVAAPVIAPLPVAPTPAPPLPAEVPVPDFAATLIALAADSPPPSFMEAAAPVAPIDRPPEMRPARVAGETTSGRLVPAPLHENPIAPPEPPAAAPEQHSADVIPFPSTPPEPIAADDAPIEPVAAVEPELAPEVEPVEPKPVAEPVDEDAAMRAIEGNWTPRRRPAPVARPAPVPPPEGVNQAVAGSARAVAAARRSAEAVVAEAALDSGRPRGLEAPHEGGKDDLTHIIGVLPVIETALNRLGIYHFDQVAALSDENVGWIEGHLGIPGRIGRELWREQARELSAVLKPRRAAEN
jgi:predicted flap endonuclease-1-like 5' DNA nuclease